MKRKRLLRKKENKYAWNQATIPSIRIVVLLRLLGTDPITPSLVVG